MHDGTVVTPLLEWRLDDSERCPSFPGGCFKYPLEKLQRIDTDIGLRFSVRLFAYNNAGHFTMNETESFLIPSRYPPGQAIVKDVNPDIQNSGSNDVNRDVDVHFTGNTICSQWNGFKHHEKIQMEIGIGTDQMKADVIPFQPTNDSQKTCIKSPDIHFNTKYFVLLRASCSGGNTTSTSNGITILNDTDLLSNLNIKFGQSFTNFIRIPNVNGSAQEICFTNDTDIGARYKLILYNATQTLNVISKDFYEENKMYDKVNKRLSLDIIPYTKRICIMINSSLDKPTSVDLYKEENNEYVSANKNLLVSWSYMNPETIQSLHFKIALASFLDENSTMVQISNFQRTSGHTVHMFSLKHIHNEEETHAIALVPCTNFICLNYTLSHIFKIEQVIRPGKINQADIVHEGDDKYKTVKISWKAFETRSEITVYQWSLSRDKAAKDLLSEWNVVKCIPSSNDYKVKLCLFLYILIISEKISLHH